MQLTIDTANLSDLDRAVLACLVSKPEVAEKVKAPVKKKKSPEPEAEEELIDGPSLSDAITAATKLVSEGEASRVKAALAEVGAKRVSDLAAGDVAAFISALEE